MAITQGMCVSFKEEILIGVHDLTSDVLKMALFTESATLSPLTTAYSTSNEVSGTGYSAGGNTVSDVLISSSGSSALIDFANVVWSTSTFITRGALLYNSSKQNRAIAVFDFGSNISVVSGNFELTVPTSSPSTAILRIS